MQHRERGGGAWAGLRTAAACAFLLWQLGMIGYARIDPGRYFTWSPHDVVWNFELEVELGGRVLDHDAAVARYGLRRYRRHEHAVEHVKRAVRQYESTYGAGDGARVRLTYDKNGHDPEVWTWPDERVERGGPGPPERRRPGADGAPEERDER